MSQIASRNFEEWFGFVGCWRARRCFITRHRLRFFSLDVTHAAPLRPSFCPTCTMSSWLDCCVSAKRAMWSSWIFYGNVRWKVKTHIRHCSCHKISFRGVFVLFKKKEKKRVLAAPDICSPVQQFILIIYLQYITSTFIFCYFMKKNSKNTRGKKGKSKKLLSEVKSLFFLSGVADMPVSTSARTTQMLK